MVVWNLVFDIGATNVRAGLVKETKKDSQFLITRHYLTKEFKTATELLKRSLKDFGVDSVKNAFFSLAGPVDNQKKAKLTLADFSLERKSLLLTKKVEEVFFCNDLYAMAAGLPTYPQEEMKVLQKGEMKEFPNRIGVIGVGTGLGGAMLLYDSKTKSYELLDSEMGHVHFPAQTLDEIKLLNFVKKKRGRERVSRESLVSGKALSYIYEFKTKKKLSPAEIVKLKTKDQAAKETIELFMKFFGRISRDYVLEMNLDALVLAGGVLAHNKNFPKAPFLEEFLEYVYFKERFKSIPIYSIHDDNLALQGLIELMK